MGTGFINVDIDVESMNSFRKAEKAPVGPGHVVLQRRIVQFTPARSSTA